MATIDVSRETDRDLTVFTVTGALTATDILEAIREHYTPELTRNLLWDATGGSVSSIAPSEFRLIARTMQDVAPRRQGGKTAFVGLPDLDFGLGRMDESYAELEDLPIAYRTFRSTTDAMQWLLSHDEE